MPSPPSSACPRTEYQTREQPQPEQQPDEQAASRGGAKARGPAATATAASFAARKQWDAKARSFQRGLEHVRVCRAGDACGSSLCHATRRLMRTYTSHSCNKTASADCRVCKLWHFLVAQRKDQEPPLQTQTQTQASLQRALAQQGAMGCGWAWSAHSRRMNARSSAALHRRIVGSHKEAQSLRRRF